MKGLVSDVLYSSSRVSRVSGAGGRAKTFSVGRFIWLLLYYRVFRGTYQYSVNIPFPIFKGLCVSRLSLFVSVIVLGFYRC